MGFAVGLTGNIASGKTLAAKIFSSFGIDVFNADAISRELTTPGSPALKTIAEHYGSTIVLENGELNRKLLRDIIFSKPKERQWLEDILHPLIRAELAQRVKLSTTPYCVVEIPLLLNKKNYPYLNKILVITAPHHLQISRVMERDNCTQEQAQAILAAQPDDNARMEYADDLIMNSEGIDSLKRQLERLHQQYLRLAQAW